MGAGFVILSWLLFAAIYGFIFLVFVGLWFLGKKKKISWLKWFGGVPAVGMVALALFAIGFIAWGIICSVNPRWVFKDTFNVAPPPSVSQIQSSFYSFADTGVVYLRFQTTQDEFEKLVSTNLVKKTAEEMERDTPGESGGDIPKWWDYQIQSGWIYYLRVSPVSNSSGNREFASETECFAYNPKTLTAYYHFVGID
jgi:hypothetical protein